MQTFRVPLKKHVYLFGRGMKPFARFDCSASLEDSDSRDAMLVTRLAPGVLPIKNTWDSFKGVTPAGTEFHVGYIKNGRYDKLEVLDYDRGEFSVECEPRVHLEYADRLVEAGLLNPEAMNPRLIPCYGGRQ